MKMRKRKKGWLIYAIWHGVAWYFFFNFIYSFIQFHFIVSFYTFTVVTTPAAAAFTWTQNENKKLKV